MMIVSDACTMLLIKNDSKNVNDTSRSIIDDFRVMLQIVP
jgi:hypothetical protein